MARTSPASSFASSSSSTLQPSGFPSSSPAIRKKKNIGALLSSYYNLDNDKKSVASDVSFPAVAGSSSQSKEGKCAGAIGATPAFTAVKQLQRQSRIPSSFVSGSDREAGGACNQPAGDSSVVEGFNPFPAREDSPCAVSSGPLEKRDEVSILVFSRSPRGAAGEGRGGATAADNGSGSSRSSIRGNSIMEAMRRNRDGRLGDETATTLSSKPKVHGTAGAIPASAEGGKGFVAAAEGALAAATGGLGFLLGGEEDGNNDNRDDSRGIQKEEETGLFHSKDHSRTDLDSEHFDVRAYFSAAVENMSLRELLQASSKLDEEVKQCEGELQMLVYENYTKFLEAAETVRGVKEDMQALEGDMTQLAVRAAAIEGSSKELDDLVRDRAASIEELVSFRQLLDKLQILFTLPDVLRWYLSNDDIENMVSLYLHIHPFLHQQTTAYPLLQRLRLLHTEATTLFQTARERLKRQLFVSQIARDCEAKGISPEVRCWPRSSPRTSKRDSSNDRPTNNSREDVFLRNQRFPVDTVEQEERLVSAAAASRIFDLLLRAGESPRELLNLYMRNRMHKLRLVLRQVFSMRHLLLEVEPTLQDHENATTRQHQHSGEHQQLEHQQQQHAPEPQRQQHAPEQQREPEQRQHNRRGVCSGDESTTSQRFYVPAEGVTAGPSRDNSSASTAAATAEDTPAVANAPSAAAEQMLQVACRNLSERFMEPFLTALQDILRLRPSVGNSPAAPAQANGGGSALAAVAPLSSAALEIERRGENAASRYDSEPATSFDADTKTDRVSAVINAGKAPPNSLSNNELDEKIFLFLVPLMLQVLKGFLRLIALLHPPAAAVIETMRKLRAVLLQPQHRLALPELLQQRTTEYFHNFTYQVLSVCVADAFRSAYFQAAEELAGIQRFCFSCPASAADAAVGEAASSSDSVASAAAADTPHASKLPCGQNCSLRHAEASPGLTQVESLCFFLNEMQQEEAQQLLSQKEHALLLRGCLAVTDVHKLVEGVCGVSSSLTEKLVVHELGTWTGGYFSVFVAALLRLVRDTPAALQSSPLLRAEAEFLRLKEIAGCNGRSGADGKDDKSTVSMIGSQGMIVESKMNLTDFLRNASFTNEDEEKTEGTRMRCYSCCYCWRFSAAATAGNRASNFREGKRDDLMYDASDIALLEKAFVSRCVSVEEEVAGAVAAAVIQHLATFSRGTATSPSTGGDDRSSSQKGLETEYSKRPDKQPVEHSAVDGPEPRRPCNRSSEVASETDIPRTDASAHEGHVESLKRDAFVKRSMCSGSEMEARLNATGKGTNLLYIGKTAVCCVLLMRLGRSLELHGVSKVVAVAAELFPSFPINFFTSPTSGPGPGGLQTAAADGSAAATDIAEPPGGEHKTAHYMVAKEPPVTRLRGVLHAALVTYVYLRGCQGASSGTAALRQMLLYKPPSDALPTLASTAVVAPCTACHRTADDSPAPAILSDNATSAFQDAKPMAEGTGGGEGKYDKAGEWLRLKDREAQDRLNAPPVHRELGTNKTATPATTPPTEGQFGLPANAEGALSQREAPDASTNASVADGHSSNPTSTAESSAFLNAQKDVSCGIQYCTGDIATRSEGGAAACDDAAPASLRGENATDSPGDDTAGNAGWDGGDAVSGEAVTGEGGVQSVPVRVKGLMDSLLLLLHHCDEEMFVFLGEQRLAGSGMLLLRKGSGIGGMSGALLPGSARLPRRLQATAAEDDAGTTVEQRQHQHVRRLARLFGRRRTAIEKEMERLFARKQPVFSRVSLHRHKTLMAIFKVACRPLLEAVRSALFARLDVRQMQVECAAAAENVRDLVASEDGCVVDGLLDELVASSLRRCVHASQADELAADACCAAAGSMDSRVFVGSRGGRSTARADICRSFPTAAVSQWSSTAADGNASAAYMLMAEGRAVGTGEKDDNGVLLEPAVVEEICNRSNDRYHHLLTSSKCM